MTTAVFSSVLAFIAPFLYTSTTPTSSPDAAGADIITASSKIASQASAAIDHVGHHARAVGKTGQEGLIAHGIVGMGELLGSIGGGVSISGSGGGLSWRYLGTAIWDPPLPPVLSYIPFVCRMIAAMIAIPFIICVSLDLASHLIARTLHLYPKDIRASRSSLPKPRESSYEAFVDPVVPLASLHSTSPVGTKNDRGETPDGAKSSAVESLRLNQRTSSRRRGTALQLDEGDGQRDLIIDPGFSSGAGILPSGVTSSAPSTSSSPITPRPFSTSNASSIPHPSGSDSSRSGARQPLTSTESTYSSTSASTSASVSSSSSEDEDGASPGARYPRRTESRLRSRPGDAWHPSTSDGSDVGQQKVQGDNHDEEEVRFRTGGPEGMLRDRNDSLMFERGSGLCDLGADDVMGTDAGGQARSDGNTTSGSDEEGDMLERVRTVQAGDGARSRSGRSSFSADDTIDGTSDDSTYIVSTDGPLTVLDRSRTPRQGGHVQADPSFPTVPSPKPSSKDNEVAGGAAETCIAILCLSSTLEQVKHMLREITLVAPTADPRNVVWPWKIDNKYYTADVCFRVFATSGSGNAPETGQDGVRWDDCPAIVCVVPEKDAAVVPKHLAALLYEPSSPEVSIALILDTGSTGENTLGSRPDVEAIEEAWDAAEFEVLDLRGREDGKQQSHDGSAETASAGAREDDGSRVDDELDPMDRLKEALQTILWPNLVRKPKSRPAQDAKSIATDRHDDTDQTTAAPTSFAVNFARLKQRGPETSVARQVNASETGVTGGAWGDRGVAVRDEEFAKLDAWFDDDRGGLVPGPEAPATGGGGGSSGSASSASFEDDFSAFVAGPAGPPSSSAHRDNPSRSASDSPDLDALIDPTSLLLHLTNVRGELSGVADEDERRARAGREVERVLESLGLGGMTGFDEVDEEVEPVGPLSPEEQ